MPDERNLTRRDFLATAAITTGGMAFAGSGTAAATAGEALARAVSKPKRGGTLRLGTSDSSTSDTLEALYADATFTQNFFARALYDTLMDLDPKSYRPIPMLAEELIPAKDLRYWDVRLRRGATFHNGKNLTADDVIFSLRRILNPKAAATAAALIVSIDPKRLKKMDARTVRIHLKYPDIGIPYALAQPGCSIVPIGYNPKKPIGTGPFKLKTFTPGVRSVFARNDHYWQHGKPYLDELHIVGFADPATTRVNALTSGQIDAADHILVNLVPTVQSNHNLKVLNSKAYGYHTFETRMDVPPFNDVRVRQALRLIANRPQIVSQAFGGTPYASVANDWPAFQDPLYDHSIPQHHQDIQHAKSLLKRAGRSDLTVELVVSPLAAGVVETAQVLAQQAKQAGVTIKINNVHDATTYFNKYFQKAAFKFDFFNTNPIWIHVGFSLLPTSPYNLSNWRDRKWLQLVTQARGTLNTAKRKELMAEAQRIFSERGSQDIFAFFNTVDAYNKKFTNFHTDVGGKSLGMQVANVHLA